MFFWPNQALKREPVPVLIMYDASFFQSNSKVKHSMK